VYLQEEIHSWISNNAKQLTRLSEEKRTQQWSPEADAAFRVPKEAPCTAPVPGYPRPGEKLIINTDASSVVLRDQPKTTVMTRENKLRPTSRNGEAITENYIVVTEGLCMLKGVESRCLHSARKWSRWSWLTTRAVVGPG
jgi:hypothetical protein